MSVEVAVDVSDLHCGSVVGLAPPETKTIDGNVVGFGDNKHQEWLWECWTDGIRQVKEIVGTSEAALFVNGDATEGCHHRNESTLIAAAIETHTDMAITATKPLADICSVRFVVKGTECHTQNMENVLAEKIGAVDKKAKDKWLVEIHGCLLDVAHHMTTTGRANLEASAMSILMMNARVNYERASSETSRHRIPDVFLRAHRHCGGYYSDGRGIFGVTGAWQMLTRHGFKVVTDSIPRPSMLVLDWRGKPKGSLPIVHNIQFNPPPHAITVV